jgi:ParB-like chromosome segregation protein Spo0J/DNA modification methylase
MEETTGSGPEGHEGAGFGSEVTVESSRLIPIADIAVFDRIRKRVTKIEEMAVSLQHHGQLQAVTIRRPDERDDPLQVKGKPYVLVTGGRRLAGAVLNGWKEIRAEELANLSPYRRMKIELEENLQREEMHYADVVETKLRLHELYKSENPNHQIGDTAAAIGESIANVSRDLQLAQALREKPELRNAGSKKAAATAVKIESYARARELDVAARGGAVGTFQNRMVTDDMRNWLRRLKDGSVDMVASDLPYGIDYFDLPVGEAMSTYDDSKDTTRDLLTDVVPQLLRVTNVNGWLALMAGWEGTEYVKKLIQDCCITHFDYRKEGKQYCPGGVSKLSEKCQYLKLPPKPWIWFRPNSRNNAMHPDLSAQNQYEPILIVNRGQGKIITTERMGNVLVHDAIYTDRIHEMQKPVSLWEDIIGRFMVRGSLVIDPCFGSGSGLAAAANLSMNFAGCELNPAMRGPAIGFVSQYSKGEVTI